MRYDVSQEMGRARMTKTPVSRCEDHCHYWDTGGGFGVIIGVSRCLVCGALSTTADFPRSKRAATGEGSPNSDDLRKLSQEEEL
jgi:hypothetical protein